MSAAPSFLLPVLVSLAASGRVSGLLSTMADVAPVFGGFVPAGVVGSHGGMPGRHPHGQGLEFLVQEKLLLSQKGGPSPTCSRGPSPPALGSSECSLCPGMCIHVCLVHLCSCDVGWSSVVLHLGLWGPTIGEQGAGTGGGWWPDLPLPVHEHLGQQ